MVHVFCSFSQPLTLIVCSFAHEPLGGPSDDAATGDGGISNSSIAYAFAALFGAMVVVGSVGYTLRKRSMPRSSRGSASVKSCASVSDCFLLPLSSNSQWNFPIRESSFSGMSPTSAPSSPTPDLESGMTIQGAGDHGGDVFSHDLANVTRGYGGSAGGNIRASLSTFIVRENQLGKEPDTKETGCCMSQGYPWYLTHRYSKPVMVHKLVFTGSSARAEQGNIGDLRQEIRRLQAIRHESIHEVLGLCVPQGTPGDGAHALQHLPLACLQ